MIAHIRGSALFGAGEVPSSKSVAHREFIAAFLSGKQTVFHGNFDVGDIQTTLDCLSRLGAEIIPTIDGLKLLRKREADSVRLWAADSGSTLRFILPVVAALGTIAEIDGTERLANRPIRELLRVLSEHGAEYSSDGLPLIARGKLRSGEFVVPASISSQYITGILLALPFLSGDSRLELTGKIVSAPYIEITEKVLEKYGAKFRKTDFGYFVEGESYRGAESSIIESDWSSACFIAAMGALCGKTTCRNLNADSAQGDKIIVDILNKIGAKTETRGGELCVEKGKLMPVEFDATNSPDIVPVLAAVLAFCDGDSAVFGVGRLRDKESDRLDGVIKMLEAFKISSTLSGDALIIHGGTPRAGKYFSPDDHRMAMAATVIALATDGESRVYGAECVKKSFPCFFDEVKKLGGQVDVRAV